jgi:hypothetical protein
MSRSATQLERRHDRVRQGHGRLSKHATKQMALLGRTLEDISSTILTGGIIREYPEEKLYPAFLLLGYPGHMDDPCYVVVASHDGTVIVTIHNWDPTVYEADHRTRRPQP